jgi:hypothetical protein
MEKSKICPECGHEFKGNGWDGIDAHWRSKHDETTRYEEAWPIDPIGPVHHPTLIAAEEPALSGWTAVA